MGKLREAIPPTRFRFGENWRSFVTTVTEQSIIEAERGLLRLFPAAAISGASFLDIGCGSGLSMLAAIRLGAKSVRGIDYDANSVEATRTLLTAHAPDADWSVIQKSVFDLTPEDGVFGNVYSWGVLHHTGDVWRALDGASRLVAPGGHFAVALYRKTPLCSFWVREKRLYAGASEAVQSVIREVFFAAYRAALLARLRSPSAYERNYRAVRGMDWKHDVHDWLGGYPYESVEPAAVKTELYRLGFDIERVFEQPAAAAGLFGSHCDEFVAIRRVGPLADTPQPRVTVVTSRLDVGGTEMHLTRVLPELKRRGFDITLYLMERGGPLEGELLQQGLRLEGPQRGWPSFLHWPRATLSLARWLRRERPDIVHFFLPRPYVYGSVAAELAGHRRRIMSRRSLADYRARYPLLRSLERLLHSRTAGVIGNSQAVIDQLSAEVGDCRKLALIHNGIKMPEPMNASDRLRVRRALQIADDALVIAVVANLVPYKGHLDLINALALVKNGLPKPWMLLAIGRDEGVGAELKRTAKVLDISDNIAWLGERSEVRELLGASDIFVLPSHQEGFSNALLEAMAAGVPAIATAVGGNVDAVVDDESGILVSPHDPGALAGAILRLSNDPALCSRLAETARFRVQQQFSLDACVGRYEKLYWAMNEPQPKPLSEVFPEGNRAMPRGDSDNSANDNLDLLVTRGFGREWSTFRQDTNHLSHEQRAKIFDSYFRIFPWHLLPSGGGIGIDIGCGTGRWATMVAPRVEHLHLLDASPEALAVARENLKSAANVSFHAASVAEIPLPSNSLDFAYALGVLHHVPDTPAAIEAIAVTLKPGAPFLIYLYYALDNRPAWYRGLWRASNLARVVVSRLPHLPRLAISQAIAALVYWPLARGAGLLSRLGLPAQSVPLSWYADKSFYVMRTDAYDRFCTRLEKRFSRSEIEQMMTRAGFVSVRFSDAVPFWCAVGIKSTAAEPAIENSI